MYLTGGVNGGLICFSKIIPKLYRLMHGTDFNFFTVEILSSGLIHSNYNIKEKCHHNNLIHIFKIILVVSLSLDVQ